MDTTQTFWKATKVKTVYLEMKEPISWMVAQKMICSLVVQASMFYGE
ncbi:hypothetical protein KR49_11840 [Synechococcus sp. KORDI-49]|nr:hypothetical protein KR49_11840 [Synechococcus sp. KORDI-49]